MKSVAHGMGYHSSQLIMKGLTNKIKSIPKLSIYLHLGEPYVLYPVLSQTTHTTVFHNIFTYFLKHEYIRLI